MEPIIRPDSLFVERKLESLTRQYEQMEIRLEYLKSIHTDNAIILQEEEALADLKQDIIFLRIRKKMNDSYSNGDYIAFDY